MDSEADPAFHLMSLRPDDASFWENTASLPAGITYTEYELGEDAQNADPSKIGFRRLIPTEVLALENGPRQTAVASRFETTDSGNQLAAFGYELKRDPTDEINYPHSNLYKDGELLLSDVYGLESISAFPTSSGEILVFAVKTVEANSEGSTEFHSYIVQNGIVSERRYQHNDPPYPPFMHDGEILWVRFAGTHIQLENSQQEVVFDFTTYYGSRMPLNRFRSWDNHWILEIGSFIIQDGEILNEKFGFQETFGWRLIDNKPFYFFRKGKRVGISYDGQFLPLYYHNVLNGYCCGLTGNNPTRWGNNIHFFGQRDGVWYFVMMEIE